MAPSSSALPPLELPARLAEIDGQLQDHFRALQNGFQKLDKVKDPNRQGKQLEELTGKMRECKRLIRDFDREFEEEQSNFTSAVNKRLNEKKQSVIKELYSYMALRKPYTSTSSNKKAEFLDGGGGGPMVDEIVRMASTMNNQELIDSGMKSMDETDQEIERSKKVVEDTVDIGAQTAQTIKSQNGREKNSTQYCILGGGKLKTWNMTMEAEAESSRSSASTQQIAGHEDGDAAKPMMVRIKRKRIQPPIEALWLEVSERPSKRLEAELRSFSLNDSNTNSSDKAVESKPSRLLFHHVDTVTSFGSEETTRVNSLLREFHNESGIERHRSWVKSKQWKPLTTSRERHQELASKARFEQVWRSRKGATKQDNLSELFHLYDIVRVDLEANPLGKQEREAELAENRLLQDFLPLFKEYLPSVAAEVESSTTMSSVEKEQVCADDYVYDVYALGEGAVGGEATDRDILDYPMIQVIDNEEFEWGSSSESEYDSEDSNAENNPINDYPEEDGSDRSLDAETDDDSQSGSEDEGKHLVQSNALREYDSEAVEEWEEDWDSADHESASN